MKTPKKKLKDTQLPEPHNPADEGLDHNLRYGDERDLEQSYIRKQETEEGRGIDNEDETEPQDPTKQA